jgi:RNA polymerase sigma factor (sigma-70 family)
MHRDDRELLAALAEDAGAFEVFYRRHVDRIIRFAARRCTNPEEVADIVASTFVVVLTSSRTYQPDRGEPAAWLYGIAARLIANGRRRSGRERAAMARLSGYRLVEPDDLERLEERLDARSESRAMLRALPRLTAQHREALLLVGADGLSPKDAARVLGIRPAAFRMRLTTARRALRVAIAADEDRHHTGAPARTDFDEVTT